jgi:phosphoglycolate phosphatase
MDLKNKKLFIFDLDGTLVDTAPDFRNSLNYMLSELNEPQVTLAEIRDLVGYGARELIRRTVITKNIPYDDNKINEMLKIFLLHYTHNIDDDSVLFENVDKVLNSIKSKELKLAICTNKMERLSNMLLEKLGILHYFDYLVGGDTFPKSKPDPFPLIEICRRLNVSEDESLMIGDSATDLNAGHNANMPVVLVSYGYSDNKNIYNDADLVINNFSQLMELIE